MHGTVEKIERMNIGRVPEKFGRHLLWLEYDYEPDKGYIRYTNRDDLLQPWLDLLTENEYATSEALNEAMDWIVSLPEGPATLYLNFEEPQAHSPSG